MTTSQSTPAHDAPHWIIEAADAHDRWGEIDSPTDANRFATERDAKAAIAELLKLDGWDRDSLRARYVSA